MAKYMKTEKGYQEIEVINSNKMDKNNPVGTGSFSMGRKAGTTVGNYSHAEGSDTTASGPSSHAEGYSTTASAYNSHAEGASTKASGYASHAEGNNTTASGEDSHAEGFHTTATSIYQHSQGKYNIEDTLNKYAHIVGNGEDGTSRSNAHTLDWSGNAWFAGDVYVGSTSGTNKDDGSKKLATEDYVNNNVDTTLTQSGKAADASEVGKEIRTVSGKIPTVFDWAKKELFDKADLVDPAGINSFLTIDGVEYYRYHCGPNNFEWNNPKPYPGSVTITARAVSQYGGTNGTRLLTIYDDGTYGPALFVIVGGESKTVTVTTDPDKTLAKITGNYDMENWALLDMSVMSCVANYNTGLPLANSNAPGGVITDPATEEYTVPAKIGENGKMYVPHIPVVDATLTQPGQAADAAAVGEQLSSLSGEMLTDAELSNAVDNALAQAKESGEFDGPKGDAGIGIQSVVQTTTSTEDGGTNVVTVTKTDGTSSTFEVRNGGKGSSPQKGTDYWTAADQQSIVDDVLAALPTWEGGGY